MSQRKVAEKIKTHFWCSVTFFPLFRKTYGVMWRKYGTARQVTDNNTTRRTRFGRWITKATDTHSEYVIRIALPLQQRLHARASLSRYTYIACLAITETDCVYCAVRTESLNVTEVSF